MENELITIAKNVADILNLSGAYQDADYSADDDAVTFYDPLTSHEVSITFSWA